MDAENLQNGQEQHESFFSSVVRCNMVQYDYRHTDGKLYSTIAKTTYHARKRRDRWLERKAAKLLA